VITIRSNLIRKNRRPRSKINLCCDKKETVKKHKEVLLEEFPQNSPPLKAKFHSLTKKAYSPYQSTETLKVKVN
jgi:hypothetical protein